MNYRSLLKLLLSDARISLGPTERRLYTPARVFWMATFASVMMAVAVVGGLIVAAKKEWAIVPTALVVAYAAASVYCGRVAIRIKRNELRRYRRP